MEPTRLIRIDDYPYGKPQYDRDFCRKTIVRVCELLNAFGVKYMIGVIPFETLEEDAKVIRAHLSPFGSVCMHGFDHGFSMKDMWANITQTWPHGGEFINYSVSDFSAKYKNANLRMIELFGGVYDERHFIAPFNTYTQAVLDALQPTPVTKMHTCDKEYFAYKYSELDHGNITPVISQFQKTYDYADKVIHNLDNNSQITLHWMFDSMRKGWEQHYTNLGRVLRERTDKIGN